MDPSILDQILDRLSDLEGFKAYATIYSILLACGLGLPIPEDITLVTAGYLAYLGNVQLATIIAVAYLGVLSGDLILFTIGHFFGRKFLTLPWVSYIITPERVALAQAKLKKNARKVCFIARFLAGLRAPIYFTAGMLGVKARTFLTLDGLAAAISVPIITYLGFYFGDEIDIALHYLRRAEKYILMSLAVIGLIVVFKIVQTKLRENVDLPP